LGAGRCVDDLGLARARMDGDSASVPRVGEIEPARAGGAQRRLFDADRELFGRVLSASRVYALQPEVFLRVQDLHRELAQRGSLPPGVVTAARLRVAELRQSPF
jgi:alkylhydroperoxidase family enzyme